jgi:hypothetical protein
MSTQPNVRNFACLIAMMIVSSCARVPPPASGANPTEPAPPQEEVTIRPYEEVITSNAETQTGLFKVHQVKNKRYFEIPTAALDVDMLWHAETASVPPNVTAGMNLGNRLVRWVRQQDNIVVLDRTHTLEIRNKSDGSPVSPDQAEGAALGVAQVTQPSVMAVFPIAAEAPDGSLVIEVGLELARNLGEFTTLGLLSRAGYSVSPNPEFEGSVNEIRKIQAFEGNIEMLIALNFKLEPKPPETNTNDKYPERTSVTIVTRHSIVLLPKDVMQPRFSDSRVGYFTESYQEYSFQKDNRVNNRGLINRHRLEKREPEKKLSEPIKPIVYYISRNVPTQWRENVKRGVLAWLPAFETAGFKNAIVVKDAPTKTEDPTWDEFDARYSVIQWRYSPTSSGGYGPSYTDPRSGEILFSRIYISADMLNSEGYAYFAQVSALDSNARKLPLSDELVGRLIEPIISHEVGHTLGLAHNFKASQAYSVAQLRNRDFIEKNGIVASIMSYAPFNYVAQPEDKLKPEHLIPQIGPYDGFAIRWGYTPIPSAQTAEDEADTLDAWASEQQNNPWLAYDSDYDVDIDDNDPTVLKFNLSSDRLAAAKLGIKNLERSMNLLIEATTRQGEDYEQLSRAYWAVMNIRNYFLVAAATVPGGVIENRAMGKNPRAEYTPVSIREQREAVQFLMAQLKVTDTFIRPDISDRLYPIAITEDLFISQVSVLGQLMQSSRYVALIDLETRALYESNGKQKPNATYPLVSYLEDIQNGVWSEIDSPNVQIHPLRRELQRAYLSLLDTQLKVNNATDLRAAARANLRRLLDKINKTLPGVDDATIKAHLEDGRDEIEKMLVIQPNPVLIQPGLEAKTGVGTFKPVQPKRHPSPYHADFVK